MAQQLSMLTALTEILGSDPSTQMWTHNFPVPGDPMIFFLSSPSAAQTYLHKSKAIIYIKNRHQMKKQSNELMIKLTSDAYQMQKHKWSINI